MLRSAVILLLVCLLAFSKPAAAQNFYQTTEYGVSLGGSQYFGDLNDAYGFKFVRPSGGAFVRFHVNPFIAARLAAGYTRVGYDDKLSDNFFNKTRNLNFQSDIVEATLQAEFNFYRFFTGESDSRFTPYLTGGIGMFFYDPFTMHNGLKTYLRPIGTEGQYVGYGDRIYSEYNICFPIGAGFKYWLRPGLNFGFEIANRLTMTDYIDDVSTTYVDANLFQTSEERILQDRSVELTSKALGQPGKQRGTPTTKDQYLMFQFNISFQLKSYKCPSYLREGFYNINSMN